MTWSCEVTVGDDLADDPHVWSASGDLADVDENTPTVLDDLRFRWAMPKGAVWPDQPEAMIADFSLNLPAFYDYSDIVRGARVAIEFRFYPEHLGPVIAAFYGRITDAVAQPRNTTPDVDQPGVTLDITAVDYTVDTLEVPAQPIIDPTPGAVFDEVGAVQAGFNIACGGYLPVTAGPFPDAWSSPDYNCVSPEQQLMSARGLIDQVLRQAVNTDATPPTRMILAPIIDADRQVPDGRTMTLDTINNSTDLTTPDYVVDAANVDVAIKWTSIKGAKPDYVEVQFAGGAGSITAPEIFLGTGDYVKRVTTTTIQTYFPFDADYFPAVQMAADFYGRDNTADDPWTLDEVRLFLDTLDEDQVDAFPIDLFPRHDIDELDPLRASCYGRIIKVAGIEPSVMPTIAGNDVSAVLTGAELRLADGRPTLTLNLRYNRTS